MVRRYVLEYRKIKERDVKIVQNANYFFYPVMKKRYTKSFDFVYRFNYYLMYKNGYVGYVINKGSKYYIYYKRNYYKLLFSGEMNVIINL